MANIIVIAILVLVVGSAIRFIVKEKKKGKKCIGCSSASCASCALDDDKEKMK